MKIRSRFQILASLLVLLASIVFYSCQKDIDNTIPGTPGQIPDLTSTVNALKISGFVTDENQAPVDAASVKIGSTTTTTDKYGYFEVRNVLVGKTAATVIVSKPGYFKGIKTYMAEESKSAFFRIKLIPKTVSGTINSGTGGNVTLTNGMIVTLPSAAVVNASTNVAYTGTINVSAHWINPTATDLSETMPGDLRGIQTDGTIKTLTTYGMAAVELTGASGELLQIAPGKKASLSMPIPSSIVASAPSSIPLWYFDEVKGLWYEEGQATKTGNNYVGEVSHFSFWNCDVPANYVNFNCTVKDQAGNPIPYAAVKISQVSNPQNARFGFTDSTGYVSGLVPDNSQLLVEVMSNYSCGTSVYSQTITTSTIAVSLGVITINLASSTATLTGSVTDCFNTPVTNGYIILSNGTLSGRYPISNTGTFTITTLLCNATAAVSIIAEDLTGMQQSSPLNTTISSGSNSIGNLQACGTSIQQFISYTINGSAPVNFVAPTDSITFYGQGTTLSSYIYGTNNSGGFVQFSYNNTGIAVGSSQALQSFGCNSLGQQTTITNPTNITITEYGAVGQFISGNFTGVVTNPTPPSTNYTVTCNFRVRRTF